MPDFQLNPAFYAGLSIARGVDPGMAWKNAVLTDAQAKQTEQSTNEARYKEVMRKQMQGALQGAVDENGMVKPDAVSRAYAISPELGQQLHTRLIAQQEAQRKTAKDKAAADLLAQFTGGGGASGGEGGAGEPDPMGLILGGAAVGNPALVAAGTALQSQANRNTITPYQQAQLDAADKRAENPRGMPFSVQEYEYFTKLSPEEQKQFINVKRAQQTLNLGGNQVVLDPIAGGVKETFPVTPKPEQMPGFKKDVEQAKVEGKETGEKINLLKSVESKLPELNATVEKLGELGDKATYTKIGKAYNEAVKQFGGDSPEGAVARKEYIARVSNQILPLLRDTYGAQFTENEGTRLMATLGDPDAHPKEKQAVLRAFIEQKNATIQSLKREVGKPANPPAAGVPPQDVDADVWGAMTPDEKALFMGGDQ